MPWQIQPLPEKQMDRPISFWERWTPAIVLLLIVLAGGLLRVHDLGGEAFDGDEIYAVRFQGLSPKNVGAMIGRTAFHENHPALELVPYLVWVSAFGKGEVAVRLLPALLGVASIVVTYVLGKRLGGTAAGLMSAGLLALNPLAIAYSQEARPYATLLLLAVAANLLFLQCIQRGRTFDLLVYLLVCELALFTHYFAVPILFAHGVIALLLIVAGDGPSRRAAIAALLTLVLAALPFVAWLPIMKYQSTYMGGRHLGEADFGTISYCLNDVFALGTGKIARIAGIAIGLLTALGIWGYRGKEIPASNASERPPVPRGMGLLICIAGLAAAGVLAWAAPRKILPAARFVLESASVDSVRTSHELSTLHVFILLLPTMLSAGGAMVFAWPWLAGLLNRLPRLPIVLRQPLTAGVAAGCFLIVPLICVWLIGYVAAGFVTARNLLVVAPAVDVLLAMGLCVLARRWIGLIPAAALTAILLLASWQYQPLSGVFRGGGIPLGYHTGPWRELDARVRSLNRPNPLILSAKTPPMDPALYYLANLNYRRVASADEARSPGQSEALYIHLNKNSDSQQVLNELIGPVELPQPLFTLGEFLVYPVKLSTAQPARHLP